MLEASESDAGAAAASTGGAQSVPALVGEQTEDGAFGAPMANVAWPGVAAMSQEETVQPRQSSAQVAATS